MSKDLEPRSTGGSSDVADFIVDDFFESLVGFCESPLFVADSTSEIAPFDSAVSDDSFAFALNQICIRLV